MPAVLGTNIASIWASKNLQNAQGAMASSVERLSSGLRINRARDDAAGLGITNTLTQQINGSNQGIRNLNDAISIVQTADGAIAAATEMAQRILTLATQGANESMSQDGRKAIVVEVKQMLASINSIVTRTKFAGTTLFSAVDGAVAANTFSIAATNQESDTVGLANTGFVNIGGGAVGTKNVALSGSSTIITLNTGHGFELSKFVGSSVYSVSAAGAYTELGVVASGQTDHATNITLATATDIDIDNSAVIVIGSGQLTRSGTSEPSVLQSAYAANLTVDSASDARTAFLALSAATSRYVSALVTQRSALGAMQNQMEYAVSNVTELSANLSAARSRVQDTDYAAETATLTKGQILQQAATAMLAQANQMPNVILSLLK
jgi:flagellin